MLMINLTAIGIVLYFTDEQREKETKSESVLQFLFLALAGLPCSFVIALMYITQEIGRIKNGKL